MAGNYVYVIYRGTLQDKLLYSIDVIHSLHHMEMCHTPPSLFDAYIVHTSMRMCMCAYPYHTKTGLNIGSVSIHMCMSERHPFGSLLGVILMDDAYVFWPGLWQCPTKDVNI